MPTDYTIMERSESSYPAKNKIPFYANMQLTGTDAYRLPDHMCSKFTVQANPVNTGYIYLGLSDVSSSKHMFVLSPGNSVDFTLYNTNMIYVKGSANDKISIGGEL